MVVTAVLRHSALHFLDYGVPLPDGTVDQGDRQTLAGRYAGILAASPVAVDIIPILSFPARDQLTFPARESLTFPDRDKLTFPRRS